MGDNNNTISKRNDILVLFDIDGTLTPARKQIDNDTDKYLMSLKERVTVGLVGGSDLDKICEQILPPAFKGDDIDPIEFCVNRYDYVFAENGLVAYKDGKLINEQSILNHLGKENLDNFVSTCLAYMSKLDLPFEISANTLEVRKGMINICPIGRSCSQAMRERFIDYDKIHNVRKKFIDYLLSKYGPSGEKPMDLVYAIGGQISIDAYPSGWDKTFSLNFIDKSYKEIHFFGDRTSPGGNDYEIYTDSRILGHTVKDPSDTLEQLGKMNF